MTPELLLSVSLVCIGAVIWFTRLEGRVNGHDTVFEERKDLEAERYETILREIGSLRELVIARLDASDSPASQKSSQRGDRLT